MRRGRWEADIAKFASPGFGPAPSRLISDLHIHRRVDDGEYGTMSSMIIRRGYCLFRGDQVRRSFSDRAVREAVHFRKERTKDTPVYTILAEQDRSTIPLNV